MRRDYSGWVGVFKADEADEEDLLLSSCIFMQRYRNWRQRPIPTERHPFLVVQPSGGAEAAATVLTKGFSNARTQKGQSLHPVQSPSATTCPHRLAENEETRSIRRPRGPETALKHLGDPQKASRDRTCSATDARAQSGEQREGLMKLNRASFVSRKTPDYNEASHAPFQSTLPGHCSHVRESSSNFRSNKGCRKGSP